jgi:protein-L-isoaspartate(D-aspartate) O-methyltransferase
LRLCTVSVTAVIESTPCKCGATPTHATGVGPEARKNCAEHSFSVRPAMSARCNTRRLDECKAGQENTLGHVLSVVEPGRTLARWMLLKMRMSAEMDQDPSFVNLREAMVENQLRRRDISDARVLQAMSKVPRHLFVPHHLEQVAYADRALPIGHDQTISQPYMVARMLEALELTENDRVLDIGTGSGYQAAVLGELTNEVWSVEIVPELAETARRRLADLGYENVHVVAADGSGGLPEHAPYDGIVVAAGSPDVPSPLVDQLAPRGRLVIPVGELREQMLRLVRRTREGGITTEDLLYCMFVPLVGDEGWTRWRAERYLDRPG